MLAYPLLFDPHLMKNKVFGYTTYSGDVYAVTCGYFVWDIVYVLVQGQHMSFLLHGIACLAVFLYSYTPFLNYYGAVFLMFELSTPFLNLVYFMDKCSYSKTLMFKLNGIVLLLVFFLVRIVFGLYMSVKTFESVITEGYRAPLHLMALYGSANVALNLLNQLWFYKLVCLFVRKLNYYDRSLTSPHSSPAKNVTS
ncbi:hypothetical protein DSO57_1025382 [Entomophthora muscae]|uniref:Uncharacterized protein n=1 Tax=Entomophthora muscae TaxID=34485 RepID=A0ACC2RGZ5_9FUNG|nr:hypothetical protein DSO57_1025382 [Entomophthora muscae]